jgi:hypothetical protein
MKKITHTLVMQVHIMCGLSTISCCIVFSTSSALLLSELMSRREIRLLRERNSLEKPQNKAQEK